MNEQSTNLLEQRLGDALDAMVTGEVEAPPTVTVADLIESGRRRIHRRRRGRTAFVLSTAMVTALAVTIGVVAGTGQGRAVTAASNGGAGGAAAKAAARTYPVGTRTDPAAPTVAFGWLPAAFSGTYQVSGDATGSSAIQVWGPPYESLGARVSVAGGSESGLTLTPAGTVQGHQAYWGTGAPGSAGTARIGTLVLTWQYAAHAWATVTLTQAATSTANGDLVLQVAQHLKIGPANPSAMPFHLAALPAGMHPDEAYVDLQHQYGAQAGYGALRLCVTSPCTDSGLLIAQGSTTWMSNTYLAIPSALLDLRVSPVTAPRGGPVLTGGTPVTIGEHQARLWTDTDSAAVAFTYGTVEVIVEAAGKEYQALGGKDGFLAFCRSLTWLGADPAHWTTHVVG